MNPEFRHLENIGQQIADFYQHDPRVGMLASNVPPRTTEGRHVRDHWWAVWYVVIGILIGWAAR